MQKTTPGTRVKSFDSFDLFKFVVSFVVMIVHTRIFGESRFHLLHPWCRIAIPVYFMISFFIFFSKYDRLSEADMRAVLGAFVCAMCLLFFEDKWLYDRGLFTMVNDVYFSCLLAAPLLFLIILKMDIHIPHAKTLRVMSTLIYCIHATIAELLRVYVIMPKFGKYELPWAALCFAVTAVISLAAGRLIMKYSEKFKILKYAY